jgi:hypothetical protein
MDNLLKEAIADAKAVKETALANAKIALEEAFTPKLQRMLSAKLAQEEDGEAAAAEDEDLEEQGDPEAMEDTSDLPAEESGDEAYEDGDVEDGMSEDEVEENDDMEEEMGDTSAIGEGEEEWEEDEMAADEDEEAVEDEIPAEEDEEPAAEDEEAYEDDELDLEAIIRELEADADEDEEAVAEQSDSSDIGEDDDVVEPADGDDEDKEETEVSSDDAGEENDEDEVVDDLAEGEEADEDEEPLDLESIIKELEDEMEDEEAAEEDEAPAEESIKAKFAKVNADLAEHRKVVKYLSSKLHEVNLLNAKLLYTNKLFRAHSLKEGQKLRVIETFDRAKNLREVKLVFTTMAESFGSTPSKKRRVTESAASRPTASTKPAKRVITEGQVLANRFKKLAGIK